MASTVSLTYASKLTGLQTFTGEQISSGDNTITHSGLNSEATYTASTSVPVTKVAEGTVTLSSGTGSIDLTALPGITADETVDMTGLKVQFIKFTAPAANANVVNVAEGASNGYALLGASFTLGLLPGQELLVSANDAAPDVASGDRILDITGTGSQELDYAVYAG